MQSKLIKNYHMENVVLGNDFKLGATSSFFHVFTLKHIQMFNLVLNKEKMVPRKLGVTLIIRLPQSNYRSIFGASY
jgi:hypothetical protein